MNNIKSEHESSFLSVVLVANFCMTHDADRPALRVQEKINEQKVAFSTSIIFISNWILFLDRQLSRRKKIHLNEIQRKVWILIPSTLQRLKTGF